MNMRGQDTMTERDREFQKIHDIYQPKISRYLSNLIDEYEAEDLTQEVFAKVSKNLETLWKKFELLQRFGKAGSRFRIVKKAVSMMVWPL